MTGESSPHPSPSQDLAEQLAAQILHETQQRYGLDLSGDPAAMQRIQEAAETASRELAAGREALIDLPYLTANSAGPIHLRRRVTPAGVPSPAGPAPTPGEGPAGEPGRVQLQLPERKPVVTYTLLVLMALLYLLQLATQFLFSQDIPAALGMKINDAILAGQYWRLVTPMFLHGGILHLGFNLYALYILGSRVERFFGPWRYLGLFLVSGISGNLFSFLFTSAPSLGSSTAIFGLLAAEGTFIYQHRKLIGSRFSTALRQIIQLAAINLLIGLSPGIDNWGHLGGLLGGLAFTWFGGPAYKLEGAPPMLRLHDTRPEARAWPVFIIQLVVLAGFAFWIIQLKG